MDTNNILFETQKNRTAKERVLDAAEYLFRLHGYKAVTMQEIADELGMRQPSLYYHVPEGKEQLFVEVAERMLARHQLGLTQRWPMPDRPCTLN